MNCGGGWLASPDGSCYKLLETKASHWRCAELCSAQNASLVCIGSSEENAFLIGHMPLKATKTWIGNYQAVRTSEPAGGWNTCVSGEATSFSKWALDEPKNSNGAADCAVIMFCGEPGRSHHWHDDYCWWSHNCLCERGASSSAAYLASVNNIVLRDQREELLTHLHERRMIIFAVVIPLLWFLPVMLCSRRVKQTLRCCSNRSGPTTDPGTNRGEMKRANSARFTSRQHTTGTSQAAETLHTAEQAGRALRTRVRGTIAQGGWMLLTLALLPELLDELQYHLLEEPISSRQLGGYLFSFFAPGLALLTLSLSPIDVNSIQMASNFAFFLQWFVLIPTATMTARKYRANPPRLISWLAFIIVSLLTGILMLPTLNIRRQCGCGYSREPMPPRLQLRRLWLSARSVLFAATGTYVTQSILGMEDPCALQYQKVGYYRLTAAMCLTTAFFTTPANRGRVIRWLGSLGKYGSTQQQAASVASLIGRRSAAEAYFAAARNFRAQPLSTLAREELMENTPDPSLHAKTIPAELGNVDAFASHSWSDDGGAKFDGIHEWASELGKDGEEATEKLDFDVLIWLDKACIDQSCIDTALAGLPVFLAGCKQLLVLAGPTYTSRLWWYAIAESNVGHHHSLPLANSCLQSPRAQCDGALRLRSHGRGA
jgi:hypothetical protein